MASGQLGSLVLDPGILSYLNNSDGSYLPSKPKAYGNYILLDEQFNPVITNNGKNTGFDPVGADQEFKITTLANREITKNGYLYIYVSNETPNGSLKKYDYKNREQTTISTDLPSDPKDTTRQNKIDPVNLPKNEPKVDLAKKKEK